MYPDELKQVSNEHEDNRAKPKFRVTLTKGVSNYWWEIRYEGDDIASVLAEIEAADKRLRTMTGAA